jgi:hypothetical protein
MTLTRPGGIGPHWAILVEFQAEPDASMFGRLLELFGRVWREHKPPGEKADRYQIAGVVVNLTGRGRASRDMVTAGGKLRTCVLAIERNLVEEDALATLEAIARGELALCVLCWIPLMRRGNEADIIRRWQEVAIAEPDTTRKSDLAAAACELARASGCQPEWEQALEGWGMETSPFLQKWMAKGEIKGEIKGMVKSILFLLKTHFSADQLGDLTPRITAIQDVDRLHSLLLAASQGMPYDDFLRLLG